MRARIYKKVFLQFFILFAILISFIPQFSEPKLVLGMLVPPNHSVIQEGGDKLVSNQY